MDQALTVMALVSQSLFLVSGVGGFDALPGGACGAMIALQARSLVKAHLCNASVQSACECMLMTTGRRISRFSCGFRIWR